MDTLKIILLVISIILICFFIIIIWIMSIIAKEMFLKRKNIQIQNSLDMGDGEIIFKALDSIIDDSLNTYIVLNLAFKDVPYIPEKEQTKMTNYVYKDVIEKLSPQFIDQLSMIYRKDYINKEISKRVQLSVMNYVIQTNGTLSE